jgi:hypothetical protein
VALKNVCLEEALSCGTGNLYLAEVISAVSPASSIRTRLPM